MSTGAPAVRLRSIDFLRGVAALAVAFGHALTAAPYSFAGPLFEQICAHVMWVAVSGVPLFFVISGFCIHLGQVRHGDRFQFTTFWRRRLWRLYPTYFVVLTGSIALLLLLLATGEGEEMLARYPEPMLHWIAADFASHVFMLHGFHPLFDQGAGNPPLWTLAREEYLYLMYPVLLLSSRRWRWPTIAGLLVILSVVLQYGVAASLGDPAIKWLITSSAFALWIQWQLGMVAADAYRGAITLPTFWTQARWIPLWLLLGYVLEPGAVFLGLGFFGLVNVCTRLEQRGRWPKTGLVEAITRMGLWSYSLYLVHFPVQTVTLALTRRLVPEVGVPGFILRAIILTAISCVAARVFFELVERHFVTLRRAAPDSPLVAASS